MMDDHAIAPVIAVMLILAIAVTVFSLYNSEYLPGLKQQAEMEHFREVESGFMKFSSDIDNAIARAEPSKTYSEQVPLGGGDILLNSLKSSGVIRVQNEPIGTVTISNGTQVEIHMSLVNYSYEPIGNFWEDQGYTWQKGYVNITKGSRTTPLQYYTAADLDKPFSEILQKLVENRTVSGNDTMRIIILTADQKDMTSGNGIAKLSLKTNETIYPFTNTTTVAFNPVPNYEIPEGSGLERLNGTFSNLTVQVIRITVEVN